MVTPPGMGNPQVVLAVTPPSSCHLFSAPDQRLTLPLLSQNPMNPYVYTICAEGACFFMFAFSIEPDLAMQSSHKPSK